MNLESIYKLSVVLSMIDNLSSPLSRVTSKVGESTSKIKSMETGFAEMTKIGAVMTGVGQEITNAVLSPVQATFDTKKAIGELKSLGVQDLNILEEAATSFSNKWAGTTKPEFLTAAYSIKSGIASLTDEGVAGYTELSGITAKATKSTIGEMTDLFATGYGIYKNYYSDLSDLQFGEMFSAGLADSVRVFKTSGSGMAQGIKTLGASATSSNVPLEEQFAILGMLQATMSGSEAGTKYKAFLRSAVKGGEELGLRFTDANNIMLSMPEILEMLRGKFGETMDAAEKMQLQKAFGDAETVALIDLMYNKTGDLQDNILLLYDSMSNGISIASDMSDVINQTEPDQYQRLNQQIHNIKESIGNSLLPTINDLLGRAGIIIDKVGTWIENNQDLVRKIMLAAMALGIFLIVAGTTITVVGSIGLIFSKTAGFVVGFSGLIRKIPALLQTMHIKGMYAGDALRTAFMKMKIGGTMALNGIKSLASSIAAFAKQAVLSGVQAAKNFVLGILGIAKQAIVTASTALPPLIGGIWSFTSALLANPITWIVLLIIGLIAVIILLWKNWDAVTEYIKNLWSRIKTVFQNGINGIKNFISGVPAWFRESGKKIIDTFTDGIKSAINKPIEAVKGGLAKIRELLPFSDAKEGPLSTLTLSGRRVLETITTGIHQSEDEPAGAVEKSFSKINFNAVQEPKPILRRKTENIQEYDSGNKYSDKKERNLIINKLLMNIEIKDLDDIRKLKKLIEEIEDLTNSSGGDIDMNVPFEFV